MYPRKQMPSLMTRNDTQNFDSRMYSNICINFLRNENSTFRPKNNNKKKKKGESLKDISTYGSFDSQSSTLSRYSWILIFHRINPFSFFYPRTRASRCYYNFRPFEYPQKRVGKTVDASRCIPYDHNDSRKKKWCNERIFGAKGATRSVDVYCV